jgi:hypothetical protein
MSASLYSLPDGGFGAQDFARALQMESLVKHAKDTLYHATLFEWSRPARKCKIPPFQLAFIDTGFLFRNTPIIPYTKSDWVEKGLGFNMS